MVEIATFRKNKIELSEYDFSNDIKNRVLMSEFTPLDIEVLEEILFSSLKIPLSLLQKNLDLSSDELNPILEKLSKTTLFKVLADHVLVNKEMRKYYELQLLKFEEDFKPGMDYLQGLLRKVPIHIIPTWYAISRTTNNIFDSIVEKYLETPQSFQRYLMDLNLTDPIQQGIMNAVYQSPDYSIDASYMIKKYELSREDFEKHMVELEFNFVCCIKFVRDGKSFKELITPFQEWQDYLCHVRSTEPCPIIDEESIVRNKSSDFACVEEMSAMIELAEKDPITSAASLQIKKKCPEFSEEDFESYTHKLCSINLAYLEGEKLAFASDSLEWMKMNTPEKALYLYRHPVNTLERDDLPRSLCEKRIIHEAEKSISRVGRAGWVFLDDFLKGIFIPLKDEHLVRLTKLGRHWKYQLPQYSKTELEFFKAIIQDWLFNLGITALGVKDGKECFCLTPLGRDLFSNE